MLIYCYAFDRGESYKGYIGPADMLMVTSPDVDYTDQKESPSQGRRRISTVSAGSDTSLNRPTSPTNGRLHRSAWGPPTRNSNSDDTGSVSSRSLPGSPTGSPTIHRKDKSQRLSLGQSELDIKSMFPPFVSSRFAVHLVSRALFMLSGTSNTFRICNALHLMAPVISNLRIVNL